MIVFKTPLTIINTLLEVLHPGAIGVLIAKHGKASGDRASDLVLEARSYISDKSTQPALIAHVDLTEVLPEYEDASTVAEWRWLTSKASFKHTSGFEFILNLALFENDLDYTANEVPESLALIMRAATEAGYSYILFHQGT